MAADKSHKFSKIIEFFTSSVVKAAGTNLALILSFVLVFFWAVLGPVFHFSGQWEAFIGTASSIITILMVFLIQKSQNKDSLAIQLKLNELVAAHDMASNRLVNVEGMTEDELRVIQKYYSKLSEFAKKQETLTESHSIDEQHDEHAIKKEMEQELKDLSDQANR